MSSSCRCPSSSGLRMTTSTTSPGDLPLARKRDMLIEERDLMGSCGSTGSYVAAAGAVAMYGPGELELYRHAVLRASIKDAKLRVWYPGSWGKHSTRAFFRVGLMMPSSSSSSRGEGGAGDDDGRRRTRVAEAVTLEFRSNARIISAESIVDDSPVVGVGDGRMHDDDDDDADRNRDAGGEGERHRRRRRRRRQRPLRWMSHAARRCDDGSACHDHVVLVPSTHSRVVLELDARSGGTGIVELDPPPCIVLTSTKATTSAWEWKSAVDDEWIPMDPCWTYGDDVICGEERTVGQRREEEEEEEGGREQRRADDDEKRWIESTDDRSSDENDDEWSSWKFPHEVDMCWIYTVHPTIMEEVVEDDDRGDDRPREDGRRGRVAVYDFGRELLGKVRVSMPADAPMSSSSSVAAVAAGDGSSSCRRLPPALTIRVGETLAEAMNDNDDHFEQCTDVSYSLDELETTTTFSEPGIEDRDGGSIGGRCAAAAAAAEDDDDGAALGTAGRRLHVWVSRHLLAFRYVRVVVFPRDGDVRTSNDVAVECRVHLPPLHRRGTFSSSSGAETSAERGLDSRIWNAAAYTLQLCIHHNFIVDGIKRDRLPWAGDLFTSIAANAYCFADKECVRWTLTVLGRCGLEDLHGIVRYGRNEIDGTHAVFAEKAAAPDAHVNGMVDYSLWFIVSHWSYQRYFDDRPFLRREWKVIETRLRYLLRRCSDAETGWFVVGDDDRIFIDWTTENNAEKLTPLQILWWHALDCGISLARKVGLTDEEGQARNTSYIISLLIDRQSRLEISYLQMDDVQLGFSRHAHILGVVSGLIKRLDDRVSNGNWSNPDSSDEHWHMVRKIRNLHVRTREALMTDVLPNVATPYFKHLELLALDALGERILALKVVRSYWSGMLDANATTFFEAFTEKEMSADVAQFYNRPFGRSLCHAWASGPCALYPEILLGLRPLSDGWREWLCDPLDCIDSVSISIETKYGVIDCHLDTDNLRVSVPDGTSMILMGITYVGGSHCFSRKTLISSQDTQEWAKKYRGWTHFATHVIKPNPMIPGYDGIRMTDVPTIYQLPENELFYMSFIGFDGVGYQSFLAESTDLLEWTNMRLAMGYGERGAFDFGGVVLGAYLYDSYGVDSPRVLKKLNGKFYSLYGAYAKKGAYEPDPGYQGLASSKDGLLWEREKDESILSIYGPGIVKDWEKDSIYQPWLVEHEGQYYNFYNAKEMPQWIEQIGLATSKDLQSWSRHAGNPILRVDNRHGNILNKGFDTQFKSDAKVFWDGEAAHWVMFYFGVGRGGAHIMIAFSKDLLHWVNDPIPLYTAGANPSGLDKQHAHKISLVWNPKSARWFMFYCAVGDAGRGIGLIMS